MIYNNKTYEDLDSLMEELKQNNEIFLYFDDGFDDLNPAVWIDGKYYGAALVFKKMNPELYEEYVKVFVDSQLEEIKFLLTIGENIDMYGIKIENERFKDGI